MTAHSIKDDYCLFHMHQEKSLLTAILRLLVSIRVVHGSHSWAIFGSFSNSFSGSFLSIWQRNKQKVAKNGIQNDVKNVYHEHSGKENLEK